MNLFLGQLNQLWGDPINLEDTNFNKPLGPICTDTRELKKGDFFIPLIGNNFNGHAFLEDACMKGAQGALVALNTSFDIPNKLACWKVPDTLRSFQQLGLLNRKLLDFPVVAITGSVGKTTTREMIRSALSSLGEILSTKDNNNNDIGVPKTLLLGRAHHAAAVIEMGMRGPGEIERLSCCTHPDIAVITNIGNAHIGRLGSRSAIAKAKCEITKCLNPKGVVIIPAYDPLLEETLRKTWSGRITRVALIDSLSTSSSFTSDSKGNSSLLPSFVGSLNLAKTSLTVENRVFRLPLEGAHNAINFLLTLSVAHELNVPWESLESITCESLIGRNRMLRLGKINVLDETYNSSPESVKASLDLLFHQKGRHFAVLGTMHELGKYSLYFHRQIVKYCSELKLDGLVIVSEGRIADEMFKEANEIPNVQIVTKSEDVIQILKVWLKEEDNLLLKGSRKVYLEKLLPLIKEI